MPQPLRLARALRTWIALGVLAPLGMLALSGLMLFDLRADAWTKAEQTSRNLLQVIERDIARTVELYDLSLLAAADNLHVPGAAGLSPDLRQLVLFDRAATARDLGAMLVIDERGDPVADIGAVPPRPGNYADRDYFQAHRERADLGLFIGRPLVSRLTGERMLPFSRRVSKSDGGFGGVVMGSVKLSYFTRLFGQIDLGRDGAINLYLRDGTRVMRQPYVDADLGANIAGSAIFQGFLRAPSGSFVSTSIRDGVERYYTFTRVGDLPLVLNVALSTAEVEATWWARALTIGLASAALGGLAVALSLLLGRELRRGEAMRAELAQLSHTDTLTGLPNRRAFDEALERASDEARRSGLPLSLLIVDADHFKRFNDRYGHQTGDEILRGLARCLSAGAHRPRDLVSRVGGEEFALLLPATDEAGARRVAQAVHIEVAMLALASVGIGSGAVKVSIGLATVAGSAGVAASDLYRLADGALYEAKEGGRDRTCCARAPATPAPPRVPALALVGSTAMAVRNR